MSRIQTDELLKRIADGDFLAVKLTGLQNGVFCMLLETRHGTLIHENPNGEVKEYPRVDYALKWLKRATDIKQVEVNIETWRED